MRFVSLCPAARPPLPTAFNSLYEILLNAATTNWVTIYRLSILFMRFYRRDKATVDNRTHLSILFMRFVGDVKWCRSLMLLSFNSLYEIQRILEHYSNIIKSLSILFMRFERIQKTRTEMVQLTFNSLYEILADAISGTLVDTAIFQFSLWDSLEASTSTLTRKSPAFNSLYEILIREQR